MIEQNTFHQPYSQYKPLHYSILRDDLPKLSYLSQCVKESMRIHPPVPNVGRQITKPLTFPDGRTVPEG